MFYEVAPEGKVGVLTYDFDNSLLPGQIVLVPVGRRTVPGIVIKKVAQPNFKTKSILKVLYSTALPSHLLKTISFLHDYYLTPVGSAVSLLLPNGVEKTRRKTEHLFGGGGSKTAGLREYKRSAAGVRSTPRETLSQNCCFKSPVQLNNAQKTALNSLESQSSGTKLLHGVTGSGKTNIYLKMAKNAELAQKSTILLVPEIALTSQLVRVFQQNFTDNIILLHSRQTEAERHQIWEYILNSETPKIIIGPRSALFAPLKNLGLIIIDEEHESSYYQENSPKYSAIRTASFIANTMKIPLILGSATPTIEDYYLASQKNSVITIKEKAKPTTPPDIKLIDFKDRANFTKNRYFSNQLLDSIAKNLENHQQTLIFHNRRGSSPLTICESCGMELLCPNCYLPLTLHADTYELRCHTCDYHQKVPASCPNCNHLGIIHKGFGTKLLETELKTLFKNAKIARFDADNKKSETLDAVYDEVKNGQIDILVGTQTLAKGLDLPKLATVGIIQADSGLSLPDYSAEERTFQLLTQVIGRVGRGHTDKAEVFIQTFRPEHTILKHAIDGDYPAAAKYLLKKRARTVFPPFAFVAKIEVTLKTERLVISKIRKIAQELAQHKGLLISPPMPTFHERTNRGYTWEIIVRAKSRKNLTKALKNLDGNFKITLDPPGLL